MKVSDVKHGILPYMYTVNYCVNYEIIGKLKEFIKNIYDIELDDYDEDEEY